MALPKLFERILWHNNTTPAINEDNLNAMSKALDDIDDRVIELAGTIMEDVPAIQEYLEQADELVDQMEELSTNPPYIGSNGNWYIWDTESGAYVDSGIDASITLEIADITMLAPNETPYVTNTGTNTDPVFHLFIPRGKGISGISKTGTSGLVDTYTITYTDGYTSTFTVTNGADGQDGVSPVVTITTIAGGHTVTITDKDHPNGQSFNVMDGSGDMDSSDYDPQGVVENAGGIAAYAAKKPEVKSQTLTAGNTTVTFSQIPTSGNYMIDFFTSSGINYSAINTATAGQVTLTYDAQSADVTVYCRIEEVL